MRETSKHWFLVSIRDHSKRTILVGFFGIVQSAHEALELRKYHTTGAKITRNIPQTGLLRTENFRQNWPLELFVFVNKNARFQWQGSNEGPELGWSIIKLYGGEISAWRKQNRNSNCPEGIWHWPEMCMWTLSHLDNMTEGVLQAGGILLSLRSPILYIDLRSA